MAKLYKSLIRSHLEHACTIWDPHLRKDIQALENVQKFALRVCSKSWSSDYATLLDTLSIPTLSDRRDGPPIYFHKKKKVKVKVKFTYRQIYGYIKDGKYPKVLEKCKLIRKDPKFSRCVQVMHLYYTGGMFYVNVKLAIDPSFAKLVKRIYNLRHRLATITL